MKWPRSKNSLAALLFCVTAFGASKERVIYNFALNEQPRAGLALGQDGSLYGATAYGGKFGNGVVYKLTPTSGGGWSHSVIYNFTGGAAGASPAGLLFDGEGNLYGTAGGGKGCTFGCGIVFKLIRPQPGGQWKEAVLYKFIGGMDGSSPNAGLVFDKNGNLFGTTVSGGGACDCGVVFEISADSPGKWNETTIHAFTGAPDGSVPFAGVTFSPSGLLYGATSQGGSSSCACGTVFELTLGSDGAWTEKTLYSFQGSPDGATPAAGVVFAPGGNIFGTTYNGGGGGACPLQFGCGTVFQMRRDASGNWTEAVIHRFQGADGLESLATPVLDPQGNLYATTFEGGAPPCAVCGTAFRLSLHPNGAWIETVLHNFGDTLPDAATPEGAMILSPAGELFGVAIDGGTNNAGAIFAITP
jgi:uncharacterized repeat protein (TIGR03803 family)